MSTTDNLQAAFEPWMTTTLADYLDAIGTMFIDAESVLLYDTDQLAAADLDEEQIDLDVSYGQLLDPAMTPGLALAWLAQFVGERFTTGLDEAQQREWIVDRPNSRRGTLRSIANAAQRTLVGNRYVTIIERSDGTAGDHPDDVTVYVYAEETPDANQVARDLRDTFPLELSLNFQVLTGQTWLQTGVTYTTWNLAKVKTWNEILSARTGGTYFGH